MIVPGEIVPFDAGAKALFDDTMTGRFATPAARPSWDEVDEDEKDDWRRTVAAIIAAEGEVALDFYYAAMAYSYPNGMPVTVRISENGWQVYDPDRPSSSSPIPNPTGRISLTEWVLIVLVVIAAGWAMTA